MAAKQSRYPVTFDIDYSDKSDRVSVLFRLLLSIPIVLLITFLTGSGLGTEGSTTNDGTSFNWQGATGGITGGLFIATALMLLFRQRYPRWWFDFNLELNRFSARVGSYIGLLTDKYPSTEDTQSVHLDIPYPNAKRDLNRWLPLVKWLLAIPHYVVLFFLVVGVVLVTIVAWFAILFTGKYPRALFDYVVGVGRWSFRVTAYAFLLTTDTYPPFSLR